MKIGVITFHFVPNQGAVLQCYAIQTFLQRLGHDVKVIDYRPKYHTIRYSDWKNPFMYAAWYYKRFRKSGIIKCVEATILAFIRACQMDLDGRDKVRNRYFESFVKKNLNLTDTYYTLEDLRSSCTEFDVIICGSDQIWNTSLLNQEFDAAYFIDFGGANTRKIAYAVSIGNIPPESEMSKLRRLCAGLSAVSLREYNEDIINAIGRNVHICIDPALLLDKDVYELVEAPATAPPPYIFVFGFETTDTMLSAVRETVERSGLSIINGSPDRVKITGNVENIRDYGPDQFLTFIKNASIVVTNSFHGTVFSILYEKKFVTVPHSSRGNRMTQLLADIGLESCLWGHELFHMDEDINYQKIHERLSLLRSQSIAYLYAAISGKKGEEIENNEKSSGGDNLM
ncbi:polysaccharide pyruvyl transferase family protein [Hungatella hathewayi]|uniref:polysaccharide pyruvyl transferase family protein n=1 Tax=Hungatella hathewayi TaxID=154046 RepID=UPI0035641DFD